MVTALFISISLIDLVTHKIPNRLVVLIPLVSIPTLHFHPLYSLGVMLLFGVTDIGVGDVKLALVSLSVVSQIDLRSFFFGFFLGVLIALSASKILTEPRVDDGGEQPRRIALAPALALAFIATM